MKITFLTSDDISVLLWMQFLGAALPAHFELPAPAIQMKRST